MFLDDHKHELTEIKQRLKQLPHEIGVVKDEHEELIKEREKKLDREHELEQLLDRVQEAAEEGDYRYLVTVGVISPRDRFADAAPGARNQAVQRTHPINKPRGIDPDIVAEHARGVEHREDQLKPNRRDVRPEDVFAGTPNQMGVRNFAETGKDLQRAIDKQIPKDKGHDTVYNLSQYLIRTEGGGGTPPVGKNL